jgi:hypothetical protein
MPYYTGRGDLVHFRGDYYRGDYYRGDPGLFSFLGKALGGVAKLGVNLVRGQLGLAAPTPQMPGAGLMVRPMPPVYDGYNGGGGGSYGGSTEAIPTFNKGTLGPTGKRLHPNKKAYVTRGGGTSRWPHALLFHDKGTALVGPRRMNAGNARALRHSLHRIQSFARLARRVMSFVHPRAGRGHFKFHRKKRAA